MNSDIFRILFLSSLVFVQVVVFLIERKNKKNNVEFINIDIVDNQAQWVYDNRIYYADVVDGKVDNKTTRKIEI
jgi:hypothetical protein